MTVRKLLEKLKDYTVLYPDGLDQPIDLYADAETEGLEISVKGAVSSMQNFIITF